MITNCRTQIFAPVSGWDCALFHRLPRYRCVNWAKILPGYTRHIMLYSHQFLSFYLPKGRYKRHMTTSRVMTASRVTTVRMHSAWLVWDHFIHCLHFTYNTHHTHPEAKECILLPRYHSHIHLNGVCMRDFLVLACQATGRPRVPPCLFGFMPTGKIGLRIVAIR